MKALIFSLLLGLILTACETFQFDRTPDSVQKVNLSEKSQSILDDIKTTHDLTLSNCERVVAPLLTLNHQANPENFDYDDVKANWHTIYQQLFEARMELHNKWMALASTRNFTEKEADSCISQLRTTFRTARYIEDYLLELFGGYPQTADVTTDKKFDIPAFTSNPDMLNVNSYGPGLTLKSGDLIISRGNAYTSAAIARVGQVDSQFSHMAMIFVKNSKPNEEFTIDEALKSDRVLVLEAHIEVGTTIRPFKEYANDGNARNVLFRWPDAGLAHKAAQFSYDFMEKERKRLFKADGGRQGPLTDVNYAVPYDFQMVLSSPQQLFCTEIGYIGFQSQGLEVPKYFSRPAQNNDLIRRLGVKESKIFAPGDMELDPRFQYVAEFRNPHKLKALRMKDMVITSIFDWMENKNYKLTPNLNQSIQSVAGWWFRQFDFKNVKTRFPKHMSTGIIRTMMSFDKGAEVLEKYMINYEKEYKKQSGLLVSFEQGRKKLEDFRRLDLETYNSGRRPAFHYHLNSQSLNTESRN